MPRRLDGGFTRVGSHVKRASDRLKARVPFLADNSEVHEDVVEAGGERQLDVVNDELPRRRFALQPADEIAAEGA